MYNFQTQQQKITIEERSPAIQVINSNNQINSSLQISQSVVIRRPETTFLDYDFSRTPKYTQQVEQLKDNFGFNKSEFNLNNIRVERCSYHSQWKDYILLKEVPPHAKYTVVCNTCYEELRRKNGGVHFGESYIAIIYGSGDKIAQIRNNQISFGTYTNAFTSSKFVHESLLPLADELIYMTESFEGSVVSKMSGIKFSEDDLLMLKNWMKSIEINEINEPKTERIGDNEELMKNYVKLAVFLTSFQGLGTEVVNKAGLTENLKQHILRMIQLRKLIVVRITDWIKYLTGDFYKFLFSIEGLQVDFNFIQSLTIEFGGNDQEAFFLKEEIRRRDVTIKQLKEENEVLRSKLSAYECSMTEDWEGQYWEMKRNYERVQVEINNFNVIIQNLQIENKRLVEINMNMNNQLTILQQEIKNIEINVTNKYTVIINNMKGEFERRIIEIRETIIRERDSYWERQIIVIRDQGEGEWRRKYEELWASYQRLEVEIKNIRVQINVYINEVNGWREKYERQLVVYRELEQQLIVIREQRNKVEYIEREKVVYVDKPYPVERIVDKVVEVEKTVYVDKPYPVERIVDRVVEVEKVVYVDKPYPVERIVDRVVEKVVVKTIIQDIIQVVDRPVEVKVEVPVPYPVERIVDRVVEVEKVVYVDKPYPVERIVDRVVEVEKTVYVDKPYPVEKIVVKTIIQDIIQVVDRPVEVRVEVPVPYPVEKIVDRMVEVEKVVYVDKPYPVERIVDRVVEVEKTVYVDKPYPVERIVDRVVEVEKVVYVDKPYPVERIVDRVVEVEKVVVRTVIKDIIEVVERPVEVRVEVPVPYPVEKTVYVDKPYPVEKIVDRVVEVEKVVYVDKPYPVERIVDRVVEKVVVRTVIKDIIEVVDRPVEVRVEVPVPYPVEKIVDRPVEKLVYVDKPYPVEKIVEKTVYVDKPYPVERIVDRVVEVEKVVYVDKPYPVEKIVDRVVEKVVVKTVIKDIIEVVDRPVEVRVEVPVPYPVEKTVYVDKPYPVEKIVEKTVYVDKPYPVEKIVDRVVEKVVVRTVIKDVVQIQEVVCESPPEYIKVPYPVKEIVEVVRVETKIVEKPVEVVRIETKIVEKPYPVNYVKTLIKDVITEKVVTVKDDTEINRLREEIIILNKRISSITIDVTTWNTEWEKLHATYLILLEDIKKQVAKNEYLSTLVIELETTIERYNSTVVGGDSYIKQQLEILARSSLKNQSLAYISHRKEITDTQTELFNLRQKIGRIEAIRFNKSAVHQHFSFNQFEQSSSGQQVNYFQQVGRAVIEKNLNSSVDASNSVNASSNLVASGINRSNYRNTLY